MQNQGMSRVEALKVLHTIESLFSKNSWYYHFNQVFNIHKNLSESDKSALQETVKRLKSYFESHNKPVPSSIVLELSCFASGRKRRSATPTELLKLNKGGFSEADLIESALWIEGIKSFRQAIWDLPEKEIEAIASFINHDGERENLHEHLFIHWTYQHGLIDFEDLPNLILDYVRQLSADEVAQLANYALEVWDSKAKSATITEELLMRLLCIHPDKFPPSVYRKMFELGLDYPYDLYHNANREFSLAVAEKLADISSKKHPLMEIFVRGADDYVTQQIQSWEANPPEWWPKTFNYPLEAGWELTPEGKRRYLYHETCYPLVPATGEKPKMQREDTCQWCGQKLVNFLDLDLTDSRLSFLKLSGSRLVIAFCQWCHAFQDQYFELDFEGNTHWSAYNSPEPPFRLDYDEDEMPNILVLAEKPRGAFESLIMGKGQSQIGGYPAWINNEKFPTCPSCKKHMQFIGQVRWWDVDKGHVEGNSYAFLCPDCRISLVNYDQT